MIASVSKTGGHLGAGLGVVELTVALHATFDAPEDKIIWDVGHQAYPHKILTGRKNRMNSYVRVEDYQALPSAAKANMTHSVPHIVQHRYLQVWVWLLQEIWIRFQVLIKTTMSFCVIGDGALSAGMAYEALNNAGALTIDGKKSRLIVILNDNDMSIAPPVGAMSSHLTKLISSKPYINAREFGKKVTDVLPSPIRYAAKRAEERARGVLGGGSLFEEMGFYYIGPVDGHNLDDLLSILSNVRDSNHQGPFFIHTVTQKGKGYLPAENSDDKMHGVKKFDVVTGAQLKSKTVAPTYTKIFADTLINLAEDDPKIVGITAAMPSGTGMDAFAHAFPERTFDVGIAEQHAVTFAAGLATEGYKPFVTIYSTFLQRAYDQVVHDVAIQNLPVRFAMDRAGLVGADGQTHAGSFDIAYLGCLPNFVLMAPSDEAELTHMIATAAAYNDGPIALRYPRGEGIGVDIPETPEILAIGKGRIIQKGKKLALLSFGTRLEECKAAAKILKDKINIDITIADARFAKPLDEDMITSLAQKHDGIITIEEGSRGGFGSLVLEFLSNSGLLDKGLKVRAMTLPDIFQDQNDQVAQYQEAGLDAKRIAALASSLL